MPPDGLEHIVVHPSKEADSVFAATFTGVVIALLMIASHAVAMQMRRRIFQVTRTKRALYTEDGDETIKKAASVVTKLQLPKPTREVRTRQLQSQVKEFCTLCFDEVDASEQNALTCRMLSVLNMLQTSVNYWQDGERKDEEAFRLLNLSDVDMRAVRCAIRTAASLMDDRQSRNAYELLCGIRPWFISTDAESLERQREKLRADVLRHT